MQMYSPDPRVEERNRIHVPGEGQGNIESEATCGNMGFYLERSAVSLPLLCVLLGDQVAGFGSNLNHVVGGASPTSN